MVDDALTHIRRLARPQVLFHLARGAQPTVFGIIISAIWLWIVYVNLVRLPHLGHAHSVFRVACECALCWAFLASAFTVAGVDGRAPLAVGAAVAAVAGAFWARRRIRNEVAVIAKFYELKPVLGMTTKRVHKFWDGEEPEASVTPTAATRGTRPARLAWPAWDL